ncbi:endonuclease MutS2 [Alicyclobacillus ferrooxydans]|uniref:DNA mismatch repair proteins mutS family domain-containing protein n=1 Tax=Alicyclobacillus ferrooxydans TaxID=471514 RepID=A0A0P9EQ83_9BACL|nr:DNA mismatch repair protein MutS [Alicyclobacillus ferrooxydans]KPV45728.1 hypothetical protein AN477_00835 [Alicyclobacillus ferrooxydans]
MNEKTYSALEFDKVKEELAHYALSYLGHQHIHQMTPDTDIKRIQYRLDEAAEAKRLVESGGSVPIPTLDGIERVALMLGKNFVFTPADFESVATFLRSTAQLQAYLRRKQEIAPRLYGYGESLHLLQDLYNEIHRCIAQGDVIDSASDALLRAKKQESIVESRLRKKLDSLLQKYHAYLQESFVIQRGGRYVLAVRRDQKKVVRGSIVDESSSGQTVFIEPADVSALSLELDDWRNEIEQEKHRVLCSLSEQLDLERAAIIQNLETIGICDFVIAKGKYAKALEANRVDVNQEGWIEIRQGRHPLIGKNSVPIDFCMGKENQALIITGPNTGGKTATLKTVGLLTIMMQCGLLVPALPGSSLAVFQQVLPDIGDGQSLEQSLSTFSAHIRSLVDIMEHANHRSLILLDELASGTDPGEGIGLSIAVLEKLFERGCTIVATTHFSEIKDFAIVTPGFEVARMEFDVETLRPLYRITIGEAGESYALLIARKLGLSKELIDRARTIVETQSGAGENGKVQTKVHKHMNELSPAEQHSDLRAPRHHSELEKVPQVNGVRDGNDAALITKTKPFQIGDRVWIHPMRQSGIVAELPDTRGNLVVMVQKRRHVINQKRVAPYLSREELYPENYDLDIVLESKDVRKKRKLMNKRHVDGLAIEHPNHPQL